MSWGFAKRAIEKLAAGFGYTIIPNWRLDTFRTAEYLRRLFGLLDIDCVIDVGANAGQYKTFLREQVGFKGLVASFEPIPALAQKLLRDAAADPNWIVEACALGPSAGFRNFNVMNNTEFSSFLPPLGDAVSSFEGANAVSQVTSVKIRTLDEVITELRSVREAKNIHLKLDTQGFDLEVLKGAGRTLETVSALQSEMSVRPIYEGMPKYGEVIQYLEERGFVMSGIFPNNAGHFPELIEFDCYMFRSSRARS